MILLKVFMPMFLNRLSDQGVGLTAEPRLLPKKLDRVPTSRVFANAPGGRTIAIATSHGMVRMKNFYVSNPGVEDGGVIVLKETDSYAISFEPEGGDPSERRGRFWIGVAAIPFEKWRPLAENDFLATLGVTQQEACKLDASVGVIYSPNNPMDGMNFPVSFCAHQ